MGSRAGHGRSGGTAGATGASGGPGAGAHGAAGDQVAAVARAVAAGRVAVGVAALTAPGAAVRLLLGGGRHGEGSALRMFTRMAGIRDLALGLATLDALRRQPHGHRTARLVALSAACDAVDGLATLGAPAVRSRIRPLVGIGALLTAAIGLQQARRLQAQAQSDAPDASATATA